MLLALQVSEWELVYCVMGQWDKKMGLVGLVGLV